MKPSTSPAARNKLLSATLILITGRFPSRHNSPNQLQPAARQFSNEKNSFSGFSFVRELR
jgi:hypothetical protein